MKRLKPLALGVLVCGAAWGAHAWRLERSGASLEYTLSPEPGGILVALTIHTPFPELLLKPVRYDLLLPLEGLEALDGQGKPLPIEIRPGTLKLSAAWETPLTRYVVRPPGGICRIRYLAKPATFKLGGACAHVQQHALCGELAAAPGAAIFLVPEGPIRRVRVSPPAGALGDLEDLQDLPVQEALDRLPKAVLLAGHTQVRDIGGLKLLLSPAFEPEAASLAQDWVTRLVQALEAQLGPRPPLLLVIVPPQGPHALAISDESALVQLSELNPRSGTGKQRLAEELAMRWLGRSPQESLQNPEAQGWLRVGLARLAAQRALHALGEPWAGEQALTNAFDRTYDVHLQEPPPLDDERFPAYVESRRIKAPCAVLLLDWEFKRLGAQKELKDLWALACLDGDVEKAAQALAGPGIHDFFQRWVTGGNRLVSPFPFLARPNPFGAVANLQGKPPQLRLLLTGNTQAYLETCGCKLSQSGGIARRQTALRREQAEGFPTLTLDLGGFFPYATKPGDLDTLSEMEIRFYLTAMGKMGYAAAVLGLQEVLHGRPFLARMLKDSETPPCLSADLDLAPEVLPFILVRAGDLTLGLVGVTGDPNRWEGGLRFDSALSTIHRLGDEAVPGAIRACRAAGAQRVLLLGTITPELLDALAQAGAAPDLALDAGAQPLWRDVRGIQPPVWVGTYRSIPWVREQKGSYGLTRLDLSFPDRPGEPLQAALWPLDLGASVPDDPPLRQSLDAFYQRLAEQPDTWASFDRLFSWDPRAAGPFAGAETCRQCHPGPYDQWKTTKHASAMRILVQEHRNFNPKCVVCHVTGMGQPGGHALSKVGHPMENVQCEVCHGAGAAHAAAPSRLNIRKTPPKAVCLECHNPEHAEQFEHRFQEAWEKVRH